MRKAQIPMAATILALVPRAGFTLRLAGGLRWELRNRPAYGDGFVLQSWPKAQAEDALEHCYRLNGFASHQALDDANEIQCCAAVRELAPIRSIRRRPPAGGRGPRRPSPERPSL